MGSLEPDPNWIFIDARELANSHATGAHVSTAVVDVLQDLYFEEPAARSLLLRIGYPPARLPSFHSADTFWVDIVLRLERGILVDGLTRLIAEVAKDHPGNPTVARLAIQFGGDCKVPVLALFSDPLRGSKIRIDREARQLQQAGAQIRYATRVRDIIGALRDVRPRILHFGGHGLRDGRLVFEDDRGGAAGVGLQRLADAIAATVDVLECVVLNSCYTGTDAEAFRDVTRAVAGSVDALPDDAAIAFARGFYAAIAAGEPVARAYAQGRAEVGLAGGDVAGLHLVTFAPAGTVA